MILAMALPAGYEHARFPSAFRFATVSKEICSSPLAVTGVKSFLLRGKKAKPAPIYVRIESES